MKNIFKFSSLSLLVFVEKVSCFASWFSCFADLVEQEYIMSHPAILNDERSIQVYRNNESIATGSVFIPGETLEIKLSIDYGQFVMEVAPLPAQFVEGTCKGRRFIKEGGARSVKKESFIYIPANMTKNVKIWAGWAEGYESVKITPSFILTFPSGTSAISKNNAEVAESNSEDNLESDL